MSGAVGDLFALAAEYLDACAAGITKQSPGGTIDYQAVSPGEPSFDCVPAIYVHVGGPGMGDTLPLTPAMQPMHRIRTTGLVDLIQMTCTVIRCVPVPEQHGETVTFPAPVDITASAEDTLGDLWAIWNYLITEYRADRLFFSPSGAREFIIDPAVPVHTSGGAGGWEIPIRVQLGGYRWDGS